MSKKKTARKKEIVKRKSKPRKTVRKTKKAPEYLKKYHAFFGLFYFLLALIVLSLFTVSLFVSRVNASAVDRRERLIDEFEYWQRVVSDNPNYQDGWLKLSILSYQLDGVEVSRGYLVTAGTVDSDSSKYLMVKEKLGY